MKKKLLIRFLIGCLFGIAMVLLIPAIFNRTPDGVIHFCSDRLISRVGSLEAAMMVTLLLYGLYGAACMGGTLLYDIERWPLALATVVHYLIVSLGYVLAAQLLCWDLSPKQLLFIEFLMTIGFFLIWLALYLHFKKEVRELNELIKNNNQNRKKGIE